MRKQDIKRLYPQGWRNLTLRDLLRAHVCSLPGGVHFVPKLSINPFTQRFLPVEPINVSAGNALPSSHCHHCSIKCQQVSTIQNNQSTLRWLLLVFLWFLTHWTTQVCWRLSVNHTQPQHWDIAGGILAEPISVLHVCRWQSTFYVAFKTKKFLLYCSTVFLPLY